MSDVGRKTVPDKGRQNRERPVTKALEFPFCTGKSFFHRNWNGEYELEYTQRVRMTDMVAGYLLHISIHPSYTCISTPPHMPIHSSTHVYPPLLHMSIRSSTHICRSLHTCLSTSLTHVYPPLYICLSTPPYRSTHPSTHVYPPLLHVSIHPSYTSIHPSTHVYLPL